jgi:hypothetical protein
MSLFCIEKNKFFRAHRDAVDGSWHFDTDAQKRQIRLTQDAIIDMELNRTPKELLVVNLSERALGNRTTDAEDTVSDIQPFLSRLNYRRILVLCPATMSEGIRVLKDTCRP